MWALRICASFTLAGFAAAFVPSAIQPNYVHQLHPDGRVISTLALSALPEVFPGVHLPENEVPTPFPPMDPRENPVEQKVGRFALQAFPAVAVLNRQPKAKDSLNLCRREGKAKTRCAQTVSLPFSSLQQKFKAPSRAR